VENDFKLKTCFLFVSIRICVLDCKFVVAMSVVQGPLSMLLLENKRI
jgi:hypothetical protein